VGLSRDAVIAERLVRQALAHPLAGAAQYPALFRRLQPVSTGPYARPGSPPHLPGRTRFDDLRTADRLRATRTLVKGRFQGGSIGYVHRDDLALYANAFAKPLARPNPTQRQAFEAVCSAGPLTPRQLREEIGLLNKQVMPALHRLQEAFLVYEDQVDDSWERAWYEFAVEWPGLVLDAAHRESDAAEVLRRALHALVFASAEQLRDWSRWPARRVAKLLATLEAAGAATPVHVDGLGEGWTTDPELQDARPVESVAVLHKQDFLVRAHASELRRRFGDRDLLQYVLVDGELCGAVRGHWRFAPYDVDDISIELGDRERARRRDEILTRVREQYPAPRHAIQRYAGASLPAGFTRSADP
jgi:hypothetical protein